MRRILYAGSLICVTILSFVSANAQSSASSFTYGTRYDLAGRVVGVITPNLKDGSANSPYGAIRSTYNGAGWLTKVEIGLLSSWQSENIAPKDWGEAFSLQSFIQYTYDGFGRKIEEEVFSASGAPQTLAQYSYDAAGRLNCTAIRMYVAAYNSLPSDVCAVGAVGPDGPDRITKNIYDAAGRLLQIRKGVGTSTEVADVTYTYSGNGKRKYVIDANGNRAEMRYDGFDRPVRWVLPSPTRPNAYNPSTPANATATAGALNESDYEAYTYDANGNRTSFRKRDGLTLGFAYDALDRLTGKIVPERAGLAATHTRDIYYGYDVRGRRTYARFESASGEGVTNSYDGFGRLTSATVDIDGQSRQLSALYDHDGNRTRLTWPDGAYISMAFDGLDRQSSLSDASATSLASWSYNSRGLIASANHPGPAYDQLATYDTADRLAGVVISDGAANSRVAWAYTRSPANQITSEIRDNDAYAWKGYLNVDRSYATNGLNQYTAAGAAAFCYDANGNLTADGANVYLYDVENRLVEKRTQMNSSCAELSYAGTLQASLRYDPIGRLYEVDGVSKTRFLYDGDALVGEYSSAGGLLRRYGHGNDVGADDPVVWFEGVSALSPVARYVYADPRGSIVLVGDAAGNSVAINSYDEYGIPGPSNQGRFQYTGQVWLPEIGMYHYKARVYSPTLGRFLQVDPIGYEDQVNLYAYAGNDPVNGADPTGLANCPPEQKGCIETPESAAQPSAPQAPSDQANRDSEIVVKGQRSGRFKTDDGSEHGYYVADGEIKNSKLRHIKDVYCGGGISTSVNAMTIPNGTTGAHTHPDAFGPPGNIPGPGDNIAARAANSKHAFTVTSSRAFIIEAYGDGTYRTRLLEGPALSGSERSVLVENMRTWENASTTSDSSRPISDRKRYCGG